LPKIGEGFREWLEAPSYEEPTEKVGDFGKVLHILTLRSGLDTEKYQGNSDNV
jgi:hypothetical protein